MGACMNEQSETGLLFGRVVRIARSAETGRAPRVTFQIPDSQKLQTLKISKSMSLRKVSNNIASISHDIRVTFA